MAMRMLSTAVNGNIISTGLLGSDDSDRQSTYHIEQPTAVLRFLMNSAAIS